MSSIAKFSLCSLICLLILASCKQQKEPVLVKLGGETQGTYYAITYYADDNETCNHLLIHCCTGLIQRLQLINLILLFHGLIVTILLQGLIKCSQSFFKKQWKYLKKPMALSISQSGRWFMHGGLVCRTE